MDADRPPGWYAPPGGPDDPGDRERCGATADGVQCDRDDGHDGVHRAQIEWR